MLLSGCHDYRGVCNLNLSLYYAGYYGVLQIHLWTRDHLLFLSFHQQRPITLSTLAREPLTTAGQVMCTPRQPQYFDKEEQEENGRDMVVTEAEGSELLAASSLRDQNTGNHEEKTKRVIKNWLNMQHLMMIMRESIYWYQSFKHRERSSSHVVSNCVAVVKLHHCPTHQPAV